MFENQFRQILAIIQFIKKIILLINYYNFKLKKYFIINLKITFFLLIKIKYKIYYLLIKNKLI